MALCWQIQSIAGENHPTLHVYTDCLLHTELEGHIHRCAPPLSLAEHVFPDKIFVRLVSVIFSFLNSNMTAKSFQYSTKCHKWLFLDVPAADPITGVISNSSEDKFTKFTNDLGEAIANFPYIGIDKGTINYFLGRFCVKPISHMAKDLERKPDVLGTQHHLLYNILKKLQQGDATSSIAWPDIQIVIELKLRGNLSTL